MDKCSSLPRLDLVGGISTERSFSFGPFFNVSQVHSHPTIPRPLRLRGRPWGCRSRAVLPWVQLPSPGRTRDSCCLPAPTRVQAEGALSRPRPCSAACLSAGGTEGPPPAPLPPVPRPSRCPDALRAHCGAFTTPGAALQAHKAASPLTGENGLGVSLTTASPCFSRSPPLCAAPPRGPRPRPARQPRSSCRVVAPETIAEF